MNDKKISIIIKNNCDISAITSLQQQNNNSWECFIINNTIKNIEQFIHNDNHFKILDNIKEALNHSTGDYVMFIDSHDILTDGAVDSILHAVQFTNADIIKCDSKLLKESTPESTDTQGKIKYVFNKNIILDYVFNDISEFCIKKAVISKINTNQPNNVLLLDVLSKAKDMTLVQKTCVIKQYSSDISVKDIVYNYEKNNQKLTEVFWKKYFKNIMPQIISQTVKHNDKASFITFCHKVPLCFIPLRYRIMCYILKKTNK